MANFLLIKAATSAANSKTGRKIIGIILGGFGGLSDPEADALAVVSVFAIGALIMMKLVGG